MFNTGSNQVLFSQDANKGNLFVGGYNSVNQVPQLKVGAVVTAINFADVKFGPEVKHLQIMADDDPDFNMKKYFSQSAQFIKTNLETTNVLVHCAAGISRSVSLVLAYLIKEQKLQPKEALELVQKQRPCAGPNEGFMNQLEEYYNELYGKI